MAHSDFLLKFLFLMIFLFLYCLITPFSCHALFFCITHIILWIYHVYLFVHLFTICPHLLERSWSSLSCRAWYWTVRENWVSEPAMLCSGQKPSVGDSLCVLATFEFWPVCICLGNSKFYLWVLGEPLPPKPVRWRSLWAGLLLCALDMAGIKLCLHLGPGSYRVGNKVMGIVPCLSSVCIEFLHWRKQCIEGKSKLRQKMQKMLHII